MIIHPTHNRTVLFSISKPSIFFLVLVNSTSMVITLATNHWAVLFKGTTWVSYANLWVISQTTPLQAEMQKNILAYSAAGGHWTRVQPRQHWCIECQSWSGCGRQLIQNDSSWTSDVMMHIEDWFMALLSLETALLLVCLRVNNLNITSGGSISCHHSIL